MRTARPNLVIARHIWEHAFDAHRFLGALKKLMTPDAYALPRGSRLRAGAGDVRLHHGVGRAHALFHSGDISVRHFAEWFVPESL